MKKPTIKATFETKNGKVLLLVKLDNATKVVVNELTPERAVRRVGDVFTSDDVDTLASSITFTVRSAK